MKKNLEEIYLQHFQDRQVSGNTSPITEVDMIKWDFIDHRDLDNIQRRIIIQNLVDMGLVHEGPQKGCYYSKSNAIESYKKIRYQKRNTVLREWLPIIISAIMLLLTLLMWLDSKSQKTELDQIKEVIATMEAGSYTSIQ